MLTPEYFNKLGAEYLPVHLGIVILHVSASEVRSELAVKKSLMAPNGFLHAGSVVTLADTSAGYGCIANLPEGATGFTTIELKSNHLGTAREGTIDCVAEADWGRARSDATHGNEWAAGYACCQRAGHVATHQSERVV